MEEDNKNSNAIEKVSNKTIKKFLEAENEFINDMLFTCGVPDRIEKDDSDLYLLPSKEHILKAPTIEDFKKSSKKEDLNDRLLKIKNKFKAPKRNNKSEKALKRREMKKFKKNKEIKKLLVSSHKASKNHNIKKENQQENTDNKIEEEVKDIKPLKMQNIFNEKSKVLFSKIDFATHPGGKVKKTKRDKVMKNPKDILKKLKETDKKINELKEDGEDEKARELKKELVWKKAFDKIQGKKVKDDKNLLYKSIKKKKMLKKKSKKSWQDRKEKVQHDIESRQKKREENINKRKKDRGTKKLKKLSKKGHIISGY